MNIFTVRLNNTLLPTIFKKLLNLVQLWRVAEETLVLFVNGSNLRQIGNFDNVSVIL
jgi:hypothetical protein